jgi:hypothetical protein
MHTTPRTSRQVRELGLQLLHLPLQAVNGGSVCGAALVRGVQQRGALAHERRCALVAQRAHLLQLALQAGHAQGVCAAALARAPGQLHAGHYAPAARGGQGHWRGGLAGAAGGKARAAQGGRAGCAGGCSRAGLAAATLRRGAAAAAAAAAAVAKVGELQGVREIGKKVCAGARARVEA